MNLLRLNGLLFAIALLSATSLAFSAEKDAPEKESLDGTYRFVSAERNGEKIPDEKLKSSKETVVTFKGNKMIMTKPNGKKATEHQITLDTTKSPKHIDIHRELAGRLKKTSLGIYDLNGKTLRICADDSGMKRPTEFTSKGAGQLSIITLERE